MRKYLLLLLFSPLFICAQTQFGYYRHSEVLNAIPEYAKAVKEYELLKQRCNAEIERNEQELTRYYVSYLDGQRDFPEPILRKRQKELQHMIDNSVVLRDQLKAWLVQSKDSLFAPCEAKVGKALEAVCLNNNLAYAINVEETNYRYINPNMGVDITQMVIDCIDSPVILPVRKEKEENPETAAAAGSNESATVETVESTGASVGNAADESTDASAENAADESTVDAAVGNAADESTGDASAGNAAEESTVDAAVGTSGAEATEE